MKSIFLNLDASHLVTDVHVHSDLRKPLHTAPYRFVAVLRRVSCWLLVRVHCASERLASRRPITVLSQPANKKFSCLTFAHQFRLSLISQSKHLNRNKLKIYRVHVCVGISRLVLTRDWLTISIKVKTVNLKSSIAWKHDVISLCMNIRFCRSRELTIEPQN